MKNLDKFIVGCVHDRLIYPYSYDAERVLNQTVCQYGEHEVYLCIEEIVRGYNYVTEHDLDEVSIVTENRQIKYDYNNRIMRLQDLNEYPEAYPDDTSIIQGVPLQSWDCNTNWNRRRFESMTIKEIFNELYRILFADNKITFSNMVAGILNPVNRESTDIFVDHAPIKTYAFVNGDGQKVRSSDSGEEFNGNQHTHYTGTKNLREQDVLKLHNNVIEHFGVNQVSIFCNEKYGNGLLTEFKNSTILINIRDWMPDDYLIASDILNRPLVRRRYKDRNTELKLRAEQDYFPLRYANFHRVTGFAPQSRHSAAALYIGDADNVYHGYTPIDEYITDKEIDIFKEKEEN